MEHLIKTSAVNIEGIGCVNIPVGELVLKPSLTDIIKKSRKKNGYQKQFASMKRNMVRRII